MKKISEPIVFFGSGPVAAKSLELLAKDFAIEAVITKPRLAHHRGEVPVLELAERLHLPIMTAQNGEELEKLFVQKSFQAPVGVLIDFGIIVSRRVIDYFTLGIVNSHFSLLPEWRGADPITFSILSGQKKTGVSLMLLVEKLDEGPLLAQTPLELSPTITTPELTDTLIDLSYASLAEILPLYVQGGITTIPQEMATIADSKEATYSRKLTKDDGVIDWSKPALQLEREIRAFIEWPRSRTTFGNLQAIITASHVVDMQGKPGHRVISNKLPVVYCGDKALALDKIQPASKKEMTGEAFIAGYRTVFLTEV
jgi:methionyl-tRNA formyltransferase